MAELTPKANQTAQGYVLFNLDCFQSWIFSHLWKGPSDTAESLMGHSPRPSGDSSQSKRLWHGLDSEIPPVLCTLSSWVIAWCWRLSGEQVKREQALLVLCCLKTKPEPFVRVTVLLEQYVLAAP